MQYSLPTGKKVFFGEKEFNFSFPTTIAGMMRGLSGISDLQGYDGMLFDFAIPTRAIMAPRSLRFPIEIAFISEAWVVEEILFMDPLFGHNVESTGKVRYALEAEVGFFSTHGINVGSELIFNGDLE